MKFGLTVTICKYFVVLWVLLRKRNKAYGRFSWKAVEKKTNGNIAENDNVSVSSLFPESGDELVQSVPVHLCWHEKVWKVATDNLKLWLCLFSVLLFSFLSRWKIIDKRMRGQKLRSFCWMLSVFKEVVMCQVWRPCLEFFRFLFTLQKYRHFNLPHTHALNYAFTTASKQNTIFWAHAPMKMLRFLLHKV